jgi:hypothetical protein
MMASVVDLSSSLDEEGLIPNTLRDEEFASRLFGDLNHYILGPPGDGNVIIHNDFDEEEEEEEREEDAANVKAMPSSAAGIPASTTSATDADEDLKGMQDDNSDDLAPD